MKPKTKFLLLVGGSLLIVMGALAGTKAAQIGSMIEAGSSFTVPPESVSSAVVEEVEWQPTLPSIGTVVAVRAVTLAPELPGTVKRIAFESGKRVRAGQILVELDTTIEQAQLASAIADESLAKVSRERMAMLRKTNTKPQAELDLAETRATQTEATVANIRATIAKKKIRAPFDGRLGLRAVEVGQVLAPGTPIVTLTDFDPIFVDFFVPQQSLSNLAVDQLVRIESDAFPGLTVEGKVTAVNSEIDVATRNVKVRAQLANESEKLRPGMFVNVEVVLPEKLKKTIVPATAIIHAPYGDSVFVIEEKSEDGKTQLVAKQKFVRSGERRGDLVAIDSGLSTGQTVVSSGGFKLRNGARVVVNNSLAPDFKAAPNPDDS